jgi:hypothetical protein
MENLIKISSLIKNSENSDLRRLAALISEILNAKSDIATKYSGSVSISLYRAMPRYGRWSFRVKGNKRGSNPEGYIVKVKFTPKGNVKDIKKLQVKLKCNCKSFQFWGPAYNLTSIDSALEKENRPPDIRDPEGQNMMCKHVYKVLQFLNGKEYKIASEFHSLEYLLTLPVMSKIEMTGEDGTKFTTTGKRGLYSYQNQRNLTIRELISLLPNQKYQFEIEFESEERDIVNEAGILRSVIQRKPELKEKLKELESEIAKDPKSAYEYAQDVIKERFELGEPAIAKDAQFAYWYAQNIIGGRFPLGEPAIATSAEWSYYYAQDIIKERFPLGEPAITQSAEYACLYAQNIIGGRFPLGEPAIATSAKWAYEYARYVIRGRFELGEPTIAKDPKWANYYAQYVIRGRFELAEPTIAKDALYSYYYAQDIIRGRWELAEPIIMKNPKIAALYAIDVLKGRWPEAEPYILKSKGNERRKYDVMMAKSEDINLNYALADYLRDPNYVYEKLNKIEIKLKVQPGTILKTLKKYLSDEYILPFLLCHINRRMARSNYLKDLGTYYNKGYTIDSVTENNTKSVRKSTLEKWKKAIDMIDANRKKLQGKEQSYGFIY